VKLDLPTGVAGLRPKPPIGVHISTKIKGESGAPGFGGRFWLMTQQAHSESFKSGRGTYTSLARSLHPSFVAWNEEAKSLGKDVPRRGPGRVGSLRGNLVHARWQDSALWHLAAQKLPEGHPNPKSWKPACEGNGIRALRFTKEENGVEQFEPIPCPNRECPFQIAGACKVSAHLIFMLRWQADDPWQAQFPALIAEWTTRGWDSASRLMGLLEQVLGTEAILTEEEQEYSSAEERAQWKIGLAAGLGIENVSLIGMPFVMTIGEKTKAADASSPHGRRYPVVNFSPDGDLVAWLLSQRESHKLLLSAPEKQLALPAATDTEFLESVRHESRAEIDPISWQVVEEPPKQTAPEPQEEAIAAPPEPEVAPAQEIEPRASMEAAREATLPLLGSEKARRLAEHAKAAGGGVMLKLLLDEAARLSGSSDLAGIPAGHEIELYRFIEKNRMPKQSRKK